MTRVFIPVPLDGMKKADQITDQRFKQKWNEKLFAIWHDNKAAGIPEGYVFDLDILPLRDDWREWILERDPVAFLIGVWSTHEQRFRYKIAIQKDVALLFKMTWWGYD